MATLMSFVIPIRSLTPKYLLKPRLYPFRPSSFHFRHHPHPHLRRYTVAASFSDQSPSSTIDNNPLLQDFVFPPFDVIDASHVRPGMRALLNKLDDELTELEKTVEPSWSKLTEPLERIVDRLSVVWGAVNHLKAVKDNSELRSAIEEVQPEQITFGLKLDQSKPIYNAFKAIRESPEWETLSDARKRIVEYIWWRSYGIDTPLLQKLAVHVLSQTCSASPCERNWSTFDNLHSKKRNRLLQQKLNDLVYIQYNSRLQRRFNSLKINKSLDPILLRDVEENDDWVVPTEDELQEFVDGENGLLWSVAREAMGGNDDVGPSLRNKRERYRDDDEDIAIADVDGLIDVDSEDDFQDL